MLMYNWKQAILLGCALLVLWILLFTMTPDMEERTVRGVTVLHLRDHLPKSNYTFNGFVDEDTLLLEDSERSDRVADSHTVNYTFEKGKKVVVIGSFEKYGKDVFMKVIDADVANNTLKIEYSYSKSVAVEPKWGKKSGEVE